MSKLILIIVVAVVYVVYRLIRARLGRSANGGGSEGALDPEAMRGLRSIALEDVSDEVTASTPPDQPVLVLMELGYPTATATVLGGAEGDASIYLSNGGGVLGGVAHENVRTAAMALAREAAGHLSEMTATTEYPYPEVGRVRFYVRTPRAVYTAERPEDVLESRQDSLWPLYSAGQNVITQLRTIAPGFFD